MTTRIILRHLRHGRQVVLTGDPWLCFCIDLFGTLTIVTMRREPVPPRLATLSDKRRATLFDPAMIPNKRKRKTSRL